MLRHFLFLFFFFAISFQFNQLAAQWQQTTAPKDPSGVYALSCHANYLYAGISSHGVYISTDQGMSWTAKNEGLFNYSIRDFAFIDNNIFVATRGAGVFRSVESEISWTSASSGLSDLEVYALTVKGTKLFAGSGGSMQAGVYMSNDIANSWVKVSNGLTLPAPVRALASDGQYLYTGIYGTGDGSGIFYSSDDGVTWMEANNGITNRYVWKLEVKGDNLFAGMDNGGGVYLSTNNGTLWQPINSGMTDSIIQSFAVNGTNIFVGTYTGGVFLSTNNGTNWDAINTGLTNLDIKSLAVDGTYIYAGTAGSGVGENGVWRRTLSEIITSLDSDVIEDILSNISLRQNYPNPFNPTTVISYELPKKSRVDLKIYDILGNEIATLVSEEKPAGSYEVEFNVAQNRILTSGIYFYKLQAGSFVETKKMVLMK